MSDAGDRRVELEHFDLLELGGSFRVCDMSTVLLGQEGQPHAVLGSAFDADMVVCSGQYDFSFRGRFRLPEDWCLVGYVHQTGKGSWCHGVELVSGTSMLLMPGGVSEFMLTAGSCWSVVLMPMRHLRRKLAELAPDDASLPVNRMVLFDAGDTALGRRLEQRFAALRERLIGTGMKSFGNLDDLLGDHVHAGLIDMRSAPLVNGRGRHTHYRVVRRVEDFMFANLRNEINNAQLCNVACVSERTLRYAFQDVLGGVSPNRYLSLLRLCEACRNLAVADMHRRSVKSVAINCGLWDLSRFAENYRHLFGELPRQTLQRHENKVARDDLVRQAMRG